MLVVGIPMWWKTTEVYRVNLPYKGIKSLSEVPINIVSKIGIFTVEPERSKLLIDELNKYSKTSIVNIEYYQIIIDAEKIKNIKTPATLEKVILKIASVNVGDFIFMEWKELKEEILVTSERWALMNKFVSSVKIQQVISNWILQEHKLRTILTNNNTNIKLGTRTRQTSVLPYPNYDIIISVLNPKPISQTIHWNVRTASEKYIEPFIASINEFAQFTIKSQWIYQVPFEFPSKQIRDNSTLGRHYALPQEHLPHIITSIERKLGNPISNNPCIHLVVYVPPCENGPLHIYNNQGERASNNNIDSFLSPKWGGIVIANPSPTICKEQLTKPASHVEIPLKSNDIMQIMLYMLRKLVDIQNDILIPGADMVPLEQVQPRDFEIDSYLRCGIVHLINSATLTLQSLINLLDGISNIVINDEVGDAVNEAYENIFLAKEHLSENDLHNATKYAKIAFIASETAFFHPSMLALLYFPDDQKYAIYIPLFLPIMIPVAFSIVIIIKYFFGKRSDGDDDESTDESIDKLKSD